MEGTENSASVVQDAQQAPAENVVAAEATESQEATSPVEQPVFDFKGTKHKLKVDGAELELPYEELVSRAQKAAAADKRFQEAAQLRKELTELFSKSRENPDEFFKFIGVDPAQYAEKKLQTLVEEMSLTPEQRELRDLKLERDRRIAEEKARKEESEQAIRAQEEMRVAQEIDQEIAQALKDSGIKNPKPRHVARIAEQLLASLADESATQRMSAKDAYEKVRGDYLQDISEYLEDLEADQLLEVLPKSIVEKLRKHDVATVKKNQFAKPTTGTAAPREETKKQKARSMDEFFNSLQPGNRLEI